MKVELVYDRDCPNAAEARRNLALAMQAAGLRAQWKEWERTSSDAPLYARSLGSPTVLVDGVDVSGDPPGQGPCCRIYRTTEGGQPSGVPPVEMIVARLNARRGRRGFGASLLTLPAIAVSLVPTFGCPLCWSGYAAILSSLGLGFLASSVYMLPVVTALLAIAVGALWYGARKRRSYSALALSSLGAAVILAGNFALGLAAATYAGVALLIGASILNVFGLSLPSLTGRLHHSSESDYRLVAPLRR